MGRQRIRVVVCVAFEPDDGPVPGEARLLVERLELTGRIGLDAAYRPLYSNGDDILLLVTGVGASAAAVSVMALGLDPRFDLTAALIVITGVAGIDPARGSLASVVLPRFVVEGEFAHELDAREIPPEWPDGFVPIGASAPYELPRRQRFNGGDGIVFPLDERRVRWALAQAADVPLTDTPAMAMRRRQFLPAETAHTPPRVLPGDELASTTFWHGRRLGERARRWVGYQTDGAGDYAITAMEDGGMLRAFKALDGCGLVDRRLIVVVRAASNFDRQRTGLSAAESLAETRVATYSAYLPALENAARVVVRLVERFRASAGSDYSPT